MNVVLFQRVNGCPLPRDRAQRHAKRASHAIFEARHGARNVVCHAANIALRAEIAVILHEITDRGVSVKARQIQAATMSGLSWQRVRAMWGRRAERITAVEADVLRALRAEYAARRVERLERALAAARAVALGDGA